MIQNIVHHVISITSLAGGIAGGRSMPLLTHLVLISELSQIFLNIRNLIGKNDNSLFSIVNKVVFFISYTVLRVIGFPFLLYIHFYSMSLYDFWNTLSIDNTQ